MRTVEQLLAALDPLPHKARLRLVATTARDLAIAGELDPVLAALEGLGRYERRLAALAAFAGRQTGYLTERLADPDPVVRRYALRAARTLPVPDEAIAAAYTDAPAAVRAQLSRTVRISPSRADLAQALVLRLREEWGDREAAALLPVCGPEFTARMLPQLADSVTDWARLALRHPGPVLDQAESELAALPAELRDSWWMRRAAGPAAASAAEPLRVLGLLERYGPRALPRVLRHQLDPLAAADAERLVRWLADPAREYRRHEPAPAHAVLRRLARADPPSLGLLGRHWLLRHRPHHLAALMAAVPPARREAFYDALAVDPVPSSWVRSVDVHPLLPRERRHAEARLAVARERAGGHHDGRLPPSLVNLPLAEARPEILAACGSSDASRREDAWAQLVLNTRLDGDAAAVAEVLALVAERLRNERDPVRSAALTELEDLPAALLTAPEAPGHLDRIARDALQARDCSYFSRSAVRSLVLTVLDDPAAGAALLGWALRTLRLLVGHGDGAELGEWDRPPHHGRALQVFETLRPWAEGAAEKGDFGPLLELTAFLDAGAARLPELRSMLADALERCPDGSAPALAKAWLDDPAQREERAVELLAREPSAAALSPVREVLSARRTDLLDVLLAEHPPYGRFLPEGSARPLPDFARAHRWLPRQQEAAARLVREALSDGSGTPHDRTSAIRGAALLPDHGLDLVREFAHSTDTVTAEAALAAAARTVEPAAALDDLLAHAGDDRARVALYAARRAAAATAPSVLARRLTELLVPDRGVKVTSRKEAARLAVRFLPSPLAVSLLARIGRDPDSHPDLLTVAMGLATDLLSTETAWELLAAAAGSEEAREILARTAPLDVPTAHRPRYARLVTAALMPGPDEGGTLRYHFMQLPRWVTYAPEVADDVRRAVCDLSLRDGARYATSAMKDIAVSGLPHPVGGAEPGSQFHRALTELLGIVRAGAEPDAEADGDLPALRRLRALTTYGLGAVPAVRTAVARDLAAEPLLTDARVMLLAEAVDLRADPSSLRTALRELVAALDGRPVLAQATAADLGRRYGHGDPLPDVAAALEAVRGLAAESGPAAGLIATALTASVGRWYDWPVQWRHLLREMRRHPEADVRDAAFAVTTHGS